MAKRVITSEAAYVLIYAHNALTVAKSTHKDPQTQWRNPGHHVWAAYVLAYVHNALTGAEVCVPGP